MTVASTAIPVQYAGNGVTTTFAFSYFFTAQTDLVVYLTDSSIPPVITKKTLTTDYAVTGTQATNGTYPNGGSVVFGTAPPTGTTVTILSDPPETQSTHWVDADADPAAVKELAFDRLTLLVQRLRSLATLGIRVPDAFVGTFSPVLPTALTPNAILAMDALGQNIVMGPLAGDIATAAANAAAAAASASSASSSATAASSSATAASGSATAAAASAAAAGASATSLNKITGTWSSPNLIATLGQIPVTAGAIRELVYVAGNGAAVTCGSPYIAAGTVDGAELEVVCVDGTNTITLPDGAGTGTKQNGPVTLGQHSSITYRMDLTNSLWREKTRNQI